MRSATLNDGPSPVEPNKAMPPHPIASSDRQWSASRPVSQDRSAFSGVSTAITSPEGALVSLASGTSLVCSAGLSAISARLC